MKNSNLESLGGWQEGLLTATQKRRRGFASHENEASDWSTRFRVRVVWAGLVMSFAMLLARILYLQVMEGQANLLLSEKNHLEQIRIVAPRGRILDTNNRVLAQSTKSGDSWTREYPLGIASASVVGYMSEVKAGEVGCREGVCYSAGSIIGRSGVESVYEARLKGVDGGVLDEVDAQGNVVRERGRNEGEAGNDVILTIDTELQKISYEALEKTRIREHEIRGAIVAMSMSGDILALVSYPSYNPLEVSKYLADTSKQYFLNRAISGVYPPGSVFKMVTAYAGLKEGKIDENTEIEDTGEIKIGDYRYGTWNFDQAGKVEGKLNLVRALARSNDIYFYKVGEMVGINSLVATAKTFGFGQKTGIDLGGENAGLLPDPLWKERKIGEKWFLGNTYHFAIGQGDILVTPLQIARMSAAVVSGRLCTPHLDKSAKEDCRDLAIPTKEIELVKSGMRAACSTGGTAYPFFNFTPSVLCKTGTAQHSGQNLTAEAKEEDRVLPHAWVTVAYPADNPKMILTVLVEEGGEGSAVAAPIAKSVLEKWKNSAEYRE